MIGLFFNRLFDWNRKKLKSSAGFTLIELLIVIGIATVIFGMALFATQDVRKGFALRAASRRVFADMQKVRLKAIKEGKVGSFAFDETKDTYTYQFPPELAMEVNLGGAFGVDIYNSTDFSFNGNGTAGSGGVYLQVMDRCQRVYVASSGTGNVKIADQACP